ncbi:carboxypeptidase regulatory-like domain-containing protein [bacterium]|nr:carboxypeptidase regulatory-like domain-containing protein [bacterium]
MLRAAMLFLILLLTGCGGQKPDYGSLNLVDVSGTVTLDGEPLAGAAVLFESKDQSFSYAETDSSGHYLLQFNSEISGVMPGPKTVRIRSTGLAFEDGSEEPSESDEGDGPERVPARYNSASELTVTVSESERRFDFELTSH